MLTNQDQPTSAALQVLGQEKLSIILRSPSLNNPVSYMLLDHWALSDGDLLREASREPTDLAFYLNDLTAEIWKALDNPQAVEMRMNGQTIFEILRQMNIATDLPKKL
ncbi:MAG: hypothetical protein LBJ14_05370 [Desulfarculales bacterium]|nr:hypothetical protein [Desulfarculales bacterium]